MQLGGAFPTLCPSSLAFQSLCGLHRQYLKPVGPGPGWGCFLSPSSWLLGFIITTPATQLGRGWHLKSRGWALGFGTASLSPVPNPQESSLAAKLPKPGQTCSCGTADSCPLHTSQCTGWGLSSHGGNPPRALGGECPPSCQSADWWDTGQGSHGAPSTAHPWAHAIADP